VSNADSVDPHPAAVAYRSATSIKAAHTRLLKEYRGGETGEFLDEIETFVRQGSATGALLDAYDDRCIAQSLLDYWVTVLYRAKRTPPDPTLAEFDPSLAPKLDDALCPYMGLGAFTGKDRNVFFGRQRLIEDMLGQLRHNRLLAVVGPSGSGKSSLVMAGVLPMLENGVLTGSEDWQYFPPMVPGSDPLRSLALATKPDNENTVAWIADQVEGFRTTQDHLLEVVVRSKNARAVLVIDQFEELFTLCTDDSVQQAFVSNLVSLVRAGHTVILTLRADFETKIALFPSLQGLYEQGQVRVTPMSAAELRDAIEEPANSIGLKFEHGIVESLVKDILGEPAGLPLLQFTLLRLWRNRQANRITWEAYKRLGDARQALALTADELYRSLIPEDQVTARRILLRLARTTERLEVLSNRVRREILYRAGEAEDRVDRVLERLVAAGLIRLTAGDTKVNDQVEVAHEALVRNWPTLAGWLDEKRTALRQRLRLTSAAEQWASHSKDPGGLLGGSLLQEARSYGDLNELETEFVQASENAVRKAEQEKEQAHRRELEAARRSAKRFSRLAAALAMVFLVAAGFAGFASIEFRRADRSKEEAQRSAEEAREQAEIADQQKGFAEQKRREAEDATARAECARVELAKATEREAAAQKQIFKLEHKRFEGKAKEAETTREVALADSQAFYKAANQAISVRVPDYRTAVANLKEVIRIQESISKPDLLNLAQAWEDLANAYAGLTEYRMAKESFEQALTVLKKSPQPGNDLYARTQKDYAKLLDDMGQPAEAQAKLQQAGAIQPDRSPAWHTDDRSAAISEFTVDTVSKLFPGTPIANIESNLPIILQSLREEGLVDKNIILVVLATIRVEVPSFKPMSEFQSPFNTVQGGPPFGRYDPPGEIAKIMGNTQPGDGARFKGRGYLLISGRRNYKRYGEGVGLGGQLLDDPDLASKPDVAARILAHAMKEWEGRIRSALASGDLATILRIETGGLRAFAAFADTFSKGQKLFK
jgi:tetratricopeptide (TPR) repeat protein/energy-coupling factor transporter ATP-binding protein EcfA2